MLLHLKPHFSRFDRKLTIAVQQGVFSAEGNKVMIEKVSREPDDAECTNRTIPPPPHSDSVPLPDFNDTPARQISVVYKQTMLVCSPPKG